MPRLKTILRREWRKYRRTERGRQIYLLQRKLHWKFWKKKMETAKKRDDIFAMLCRMTEILERHNIRYWICGGTLLGAIRENDIIAGDTDWDIDILLEDRAKILGLKDEFDAVGIRLTSPYIKECLNLETKERAPFDSMLIRATDTVNGVHGDMYLFTTFNDGIMRRYNFDNAVLYNPKMSLPAWYYENPARIPLRDRTFWGPREPVRIIEKVYGRDWMVPLQRHNTPKGHNFGGAVLNADIETLIEIALDQDWNTDYSSCPTWPRAVRYTNSHAAVKWIEAHENLFLIRAGADGYLPEFDVPDPSNPQALARYLLYVNRMRGELRRLRDGKILSKK